MAVPSFLTEYIAKNYRRLIVCVSGAAENADEQEEGAEGAERRASSVNNDGADELLMRNDPCRGCMHSRKSGPRVSGDFVAMGCMQV